MPVLTIVFAALFYVATVVLLAFTAYKIWGYAKTPAPLKIPTTPAPTTRLGVVFRMVKELTVFESLFKSSKWTWLFGWMFHFGLLLVLLRHLRYFTDPVWAWVVFLQPFGKYAAFMMLAGLAGLWARRILVDRVRYISAPSDHLMLLLLIAIGVTGALMTFVDHTDIVSLKAFILGLMVFNWSPMPNDLVLIVHLSLVILLMIIFPFSKLLHAPGVFFSPTRNQVDNPREKRHVADWANRLESS
ncbi:MAG: respiratory nitrate reductase subunit gamma [Gammaproteobacteria bacterium]|nr:respiratory nitrate reductase subunit gamma [Gammaproteobacteria bacterium]MDE0412223.1 respiratory nitrate reductase subunit gamma [Gammaproteobacteria bacterium]